MQRCIGREAIDTVIVVGCTMRSGRRTIERTVASARWPHDANLFDMKQRYADLMVSQEIIAVLPAKVSVV